MDTKLLWLKVTKDEYELPLAVGNSASDLARQVGVSRSTIISVMSNAKKRGGRCCYVKVEVDDDGKETD